MTKEFRDQDMDQKINSRRYLKGYVQQKRKWDSSLHSYIREFFAISSAVLKKGHIDEVTRSLWFMKGLPKDLRRRLVYKQNIDPEDPDTIKFQPMVEFVKKTLENDARSERVNESANSSSEVNDLAKRYADRRSSYVFDF